MSVYDLPGIHPPLSEEELLRGLLERPPAAGPAAPEMEADVQEPLDLSPYDTQLAAIQGERFQPSTLQRVLESVYGAVGSLRPPRARSFGGGLAIGAVQGLAGQGGRVARAREQFREDQRRRLLRVDEARLRAQQEHAAEGRTIAREGRAEKRTEAREAARDRKGMVRITPELVAQFPALKSLEGTDQPTGEGSTYRRLTQGTPVGNRAPARTPSPRPRAARPGPVMPELSAISGAYNREGRAADMLGDRAKADVARKAQSAIDRFHADIRQAQTDQELRSIEYPAGLPPDVEAAFKKALHNRERQIAPSR